MTTTELHFTGKCSGCGTRIATSDTRNAEWFKGKRRASAWCTCRQGQSVTVWQIQGHVSATPCSDKCTDAKGIDCECQCGGHNHGKAAA